MAKNAREAFFSPDGAAIVYTKGESEKFTIMDYATRGMFVYDLATGRHTPHPCGKLQHLYNMCATADGKWFVSTVHAGMGFGHAILAIPAHGDAFFDLHIPGCRPDVSPDGNKIAWGADDYTIRVGELDFSGPEPKVVRQRDVVKMQSRSRFITSTGRPTASTWRFPAGRTARAWASRRRWSAWWPRIGTSAWPTRPG